MRLKKLVLHGFKSFADRTEFRFDQSVTVVVGPNGCGKSNVVDAIKWVLGEQSAKSLRGGAMLDVIFNGAESRKAAGLAEVELVFENPQRSDGAGRYLTVDTDDVSVTRRLYRDGTSEYLINGQSGRLKDIKELFLDTGVGVDAYSIIEQGRVARLLEANPVERRQIFEEAAGISRFKVRKKEAQRKLEKVDENLARLGDITKEIDSRLRSVKIQAGRARTYQELATRLGELRLQHALHEYHTLHGRLETLRKVQEDARFLFDDAAGNLAKSEADLHERRERAEHLGVARQAAAHESVETKSRIQQATQQGEYARKQLEQFAEQVEQIAADQKTMAERADEVARLLAEAAASLAQLTDAVAGRRGEIESKQAAHRDAQLRNNEVTRALDEQKSGYLDAMRKFSQVEARLNSIEIERKSSATQRERLDDRVRLLSEEASQIEASKRGVVDAIASTQAEIDTFQAHSKNRAAEQQDLGAALKDLTQRLGAEREHRSGLLSRQKMLRDLEARREGISDAVQRVLKQRDGKFNFIRGLVADVISVDVEHAHAIEAALDGRDQWLVADASADLLAIRPAFDELNGRVNVLRVTRDQVEHAIVGERTSDEPHASMFVIAQGELLTIETDRAVSVGEESNVALVPMSPVPSAARASRVMQLNGRVRATLATTGTVDGSPTPTTEPLLAGDDGHDWSAHGVGVERALDLVRFEPADRAIAIKLLGRTLIAETLEAALALHRDGPAGWRFVTRGGEVVEADGTYRVGPLGASMGILSRRSELESVTHQVGEVDANIARLTEELSHGTEQAKSIEAAIAALRQDVFRLNTTRVELNGKVQQADNRLGGIARERPIVDRDLAQLDGVVTRLDDEATRLAGQKDALHERQAGHQAQIDALTAEQQSLVDRLRHAAEELTAARVAIGQLEEKQYGARQAVQRYESQRGEVAQQIERLAKSMATIEGRREQIDRDSAHAARALATLSTTRDDVAARLATIESDLADALASVATLTKDVDVVRAERMQIEQQLHKLDLDLSQATTRMEGLVQRAMEESQIDIAERYDALHGPRKVGDVPAEPMPQVELDWDAIAEEIRQLRDRIQRLGNVNLDAIGELEELEKRQAEYATQVADLTQGKQQLEGLIEQLNADSSTRFAETFEAVRVEFQQMFRKLFGGGKADIVLETELVDRKAVLPEGADPTSGPVMRRVDPLDAGIEVIARPPGKNPVTLSQLSGGEKAMTCIALLMSIFKAKPSPFCILDEVDAPLDEANNQRFTQIVQEFLSISQFIIITHHKKTMQIADVMYGVTQQVHGVSTRVPVRFDQVDNAGRIKEEAIVAA